MDWHPTDEATFATSSLDNSIALWDMSVEIDQDATTPAAGQEENQTSQKKTNATGEDVKKRKKERKRKKKVKVSFFFRHVSGGLHDIIEQRVILSPSLTVS